MLTAHLVSAIDILRARTGERWLFGPACLDGEQRAYTAGWRSYRRWLAAVEQMTPPPPAREVVQRMRLLAEGSQPPCAWPLRFLIRTHAPWLATPLTTGHLPAGALDGLYRTGTVHVTRDSDGEPGLVDLGRVWPVLDVTANDAGELGAIVDPRVALGWPGLLAEAWIGYDLSRRAAKKSTEDAGATWVEEPDDLDRARGWLADSIAGRCTVARVFGMMDGWILADAWDGAGPISDLLATYYDPATTDPSDPDRPHASNRGRLFWDGAAPEIPRPADPNDTTGVSLTVRARTAEAAVWLLFIHQLDFWPPWAGWDRAQETVDSPWGRAMLGELADAFTSLLVAADPLGAGWRRGGWPAPRSPLAAYGGWRLHRGDSDAQRRFGGAVRDTAGNHVATLQGHLNDLGFAVTDPRGVFGGSTAGAVRDLQHAAAAGTVALRRIGEVSPVRRAAFRRYFGLAHGGVDAETALTIDLWRRPAGHGLAGVDRIVRPAYSGGFDAEQRLYAWSAFTPVRATLSDTQWRQVGDAQKELWRRRLLRRSGHASDPVTEAPFVFHTDDHANLFQLEAVAEFYLNYRDPWLPLTAVRTPGENVPLVPGEPGYQRLDLLDPSGDSAEPEPPHPAGQFRLHLSGDAPLDTVWPADADTTIATHRDLIWLEHATSRPGRWFKIMAMDATARTVTIDADPVLTAGAAATPWRIQRRCRLVIIDPVGERPQLWGVAAVPAGEDSVILDPGVDLSLLNINVDTIYLPSDTHRGSRTYRIVRCDLPTRRVTLDGTPRLDGEVSTWHIPAGLGGQIDTVQTAFAPGRRGTDHYDGAVFVVSAGQVRGMFSFTSFSAWQWAAGSGNLTSVRGNTELDCVSYTSGDAWKNYSFKIRTPGEDDRVLGGRLYSQNMSNPSPAVNGWVPHPPLQYVDPDPEKVFIRFHDGHTNTGGDASAGTGSAGCVVSPRYPDLRRLLIEIHQEERALLDLAPNPDPYLAILAPRDRAQSQTLWTDSHPPPPPAPQPPPGTARLPDARWNGKIAGRVILIRPDERPTAPAP